MYPQIRPGNLLVLSNGFWLEFLKIYYRGPRRRNCFFIFNIFFFIRSLQDIPHDVQIIVRNSGKYFFTSSKRYVLTFNKWHSSQGRGRRCTLLRYSRLWDFVPKSGCDQALLKLLFTLLYLLSRKKCIQTRMQSVTFFNKNFIQTLI